MHELLGHRDVATTMIYTHVLNRGGTRCPAPCGPAVTTCLPGRKLVVADRWTVLGLYRAIVPLPVFGR